MKPAVLSPATTVAPRLVQHDADDRLRAGEEDAAVLAVVAVGELVGVEQRHLAHD
jgi:hypothetical protein